MTKENETRLLVDIETTILKDFFDTANKLVSQKGIDVKLTKKQAILMAFKEITDYWKLEIKKNEKEKLDGK